MSTTKIVAPSDGKPLHVVGDVPRFKLVGSDTARAFSVIQEEMPPNARPPPYKHNREDEVFCVKEGEFEFRVGDQTVRGKPGSYVLAPSGVPHIFKNVGTTTGHVTVRISPPGFEEFFVEVDALGESPPLEKLMELAEEFGLEILPP